AQGMGSSWYANPIDPQYIAWNDWYGYQVGSADCGGVGLPMNWRFPDTSTPWWDGYRYSLFGYGGNHTGGANFAFCDGSVHFLPNSVSTTMVGNITLLSALATRAGGEVIPEGGY